MLQRRTFEFVVLAAFDTAIEKTTFGAFIFSAITVDSTNATRDNNAFFRLDFWMLFRRMLSFPSWFVVSVRVLLGSHCFYEYFSWVLSAEFGGFWGFGWTSLFGGWFVIWCGNAPLTDCKIFPQRLASESCCHCESFRITLKIESTRRQIRKKYISCATKRLRRRFRECHFQIKY